MHELLSQYPCTAKLTYWTQTCNLETDCWRHDGRCAWRYRARVHQRWRRFHVSAHCSCCSGASLREGGASESPSQLCWFLSFSVMANKTICIPNPPHIHTQTLTHTHIHTGWTCRYERNAFAWRSTGCHRWDWDWLCPAGRITAGVNCIHTVCQTILGINVFYKVTLMCVWECLCVCVCVCACVCVYACMCVCAYKCIHVNVYRYTYVCKYWHMCVYI